MCDIAIHLNEGGILAVMFMAGTCVGWIVATLAGVCR